MKKTDHAVVCTRLGIPTIDSEADTIDPDTTKLAEPLQATEVGRH
jgi:hypothetical protein